MRSSEIAFLNLAIKRIYLYLAPQRRKCDKHCKTIYLKSIFFKVIKFFSFDWFRFQFIFLTKSVKFYILKINFAFNKLSYFYVLAKKPHKKANQILQRAVPYKMFYYCLLYIFLRLEILHRMNVIFRVFLKVFTNVTRFLWQTLLKQTSKYY